MGTKCLRRAVAARLHGLHSALQPTKIPVNLDDRQQNTASYIRHNFETIGLTTAAAGLSVRGTSSSFAVVNDTHLAPLYPHIEHFATALQTHPPRPDISAGTYSDFVTQGSKLDDRQHQKLQGPTVQALPVQMAYGLETETKKRGCRATISHARMKQLFHACRKLGTPLHRRLDLFHNVICTQRRVESQPRFP